MTRLSWTSYEKTHAFGIDRGVLYPQNSPGESWSGLITVVQNESLEFETIRYVDGIKVHNRQKEAAFSGTITAFTYPDSLFEFAMIQQRRRSLGLSYRTMRGDNEYTIHIVYNVLFRPSPISYTISEADPFVWEFSTKPVNLLNVSKTAHLIVDTSKAYSWVVESFENILYGTDSVAPRLPEPQEILDLFENNAIVRVIDNGDGSFTVIGPDEYVKFIDDTSFEITWPSAVYLSEDSYRISSL